MRELRKKLAGRASLEAELEVLIHQRSDLEERLKREKLNMEYEQSDVKELEDNTLKAFFYSALGKKEECLMKEEDEAEEAKRQYEGTQKELEGVNTRIKRIEFELRDLKRVERDYNHLVKDLSVRIAEVQPLLSDADALTLEIIQRELSEQEQNQVYFAQITEVGKTLQKSVHSVQEALSEMRQESRYGNVFREYERRNEAEERRKLVLLQTQRFLDLITKGGVKFANDYCIDPADVDSMIRRAIIACYNNTPNADLMGPDIPSLTLNVEGILEELEKKTEKSKQHQAAMELKLSELLEKYRTT